MSNRQQKRHPQHHVLPILYPSKKRIIDKEKKKKSAPKSRLPTKRRTIF